MVRTGADDEAGDHNLGPCPDLGPGGEVHQLCGSGHIVNLDEGDTLSAICSTYDCGVAPCGKRHENRSVIATREWKRPDRLKGRGYGRRE